MRLDPGRDTIEGVRSRWGLIGAALVLVAGTTALAGPAAVAGVSVGGGCDYNGDGFDDLAIGVPFDLVGNNAAGSVHVLYGTAAGLAAAGDQVWHRASGGVVGSPAGLDAFGDRVACGNFDGDEHDDLAIGVPLDDVGGRADAGSVQVLYGSAAGLTAAGNQLWHRNTAGVAGRTGAGDQFGFSLAAGDFDDDGFDDLAVGAPFDRVGRRARAGSVNVLRGSANGLTGVGDRLWHRNVAGVNGTAGRNDLFGASLATGDLDGDGFDDLAIGAPGDDVGSTGGAGSVQAMYGTPAGLAADGDQIWHRDRAGIRGVTGQGDLFGFSVATGDFDGDSYDDLAIGAHDDDIGSADFAGSVHVLHGSASGLAAARDQIWHRGTAGIRGVPDQGDTFGWALAVGDFDGDSYRDLAIGAPFDDIGGVRAAGSVQAIYGSATGLTGAGDQLWHRGRRVVDGRPGARDNFGRALHQGDFDGDGVDDLAVGVPFDEVRGRNLAGSVYVLPGAGSGLTGVGDQLWHRAKAGVDGSVGGGDQFGRGL